ncbi:MAG: glycosyltransferase [Chlamydiales bacterium]
MYEPVGIAIITHRATHLLPYCLPHLVRSTVPTKVLVMNSSSNDGTVELAQSLGAETFVIPRNEFNHGTTREVARKILNTNIVVMMTPDAFPQGPDLIEILVDPILRGAASVSYARQLPHQGAGFFESFPRFFNYPEVSHIRRLQDVSLHGIYSVFCSNSCAAYLNAALDEVGGFPHVLLGEDTLVIAKLLQSGHAIAYNAEAVVHHSHTYSLIQEFKRHFDVGLMRTTYKSLLSQYGRDVKRGRDYVKKLFREVLRNEPRKIFYAFLHVFSKWLGYRLGAISQRAPVWIKRRLSSQDFYWKD